MLFIVPNLGSVHDELVFMIAVGAACIFTVFAINFLTFIPTHILMRFIAKIT